MRLSHLHLPNLTPFTHASTIQQTLVSRLLTYKRLISSPQSSTQQQHQKKLHPPNPTILTFTPYPVYTTGRRDLPPSNTDNVTATSTNTTTTKDSLLSLPEPLRPIHHLLTTNPPQAEYHPTLRGGQTTYHGPGQLVAYTIFDLRRHNLTPRTHIRLLENSVLDVLRTYGIENGTLSDDPGVWVPTQPGAPEKKIAAVGVHLRRNISSFGIGLNVTEEPMGFFQLIVPCGLEGREATSLQGVGVKGVGVEEVAGRFVDAVVVRLREGMRDGRGGEEIDGVERIREEDVLGGEEG